MHLRESLESAASGFERLTVRFCLRARLLGASGSVCERETRMGREMFQINCFFPKTHLPGDTDG